MDSKKITIFKIPFDQGILDQSKRGASKAPDRIESEYKKIINRANFTNIRTSQDFKETHKNIYNRAKEYPLFGAVGGDHSISYSLIKAFKQHHPNSAIVIMDAHFDCQEPFDLPTHEDFLRLLISQKTINPEDILIIGARSYTNNELDFIEKHKIKHIEPKKFKIESLMDFLKKYDSFYLSIDIDAFDPSIAPGTGLPEPKGLTQDQLQKAFKCFPYGKEVYSFDIVETSPAHDFGNTTVKLVANILLRLTTPP